jgi:catalase
LLDPTKIVPEGLVPVQRVGRLTLDRNPDNFFAETEQVAFHPEIPINRPVAPVHNNQRDGYMRQTINTSRTSYEPNTLGGGCPFQAGARMGGFVSYPERVSDAKARRRGEKFFDHFSQATLFWKSQSETEKDHIVQALRFELGTCARAGRRNSHARARVRSASNSWKSRNSVRDSSGPASASHAVAGVRGALERAAG